MPLMSKPKAQTVGLQVARVTGRVVSVNFGEGDLVPAAP